MSPISFEIGGKWRRAVSVGGKCHSQTKPSGPWMKSEVIFGQKIVDIKKTESN